MAMTDPLSRQAAETDTIPAPTSTPPASAEPEEPDPLEAFLAKFKDGRPIPPQELLTVIRDDAGLDIEDMDEIPMMDRVDYGGVKFSIGTGLKDADRVKPPPVGARITFRYTELTDGGVPKCASFVAVRDYE